MEALKHLRRIGIGVALTLTLCASAWAGPIFVGNQPTLDPVTMRSLLGNGNRKPASADVVEAALKGAIAAYESGQFDAALQQLEALTAKHPELPPPRLMLARMFLTSRRLPPARDLLEQSARNHPDYPGVSISFGRLALEEGRLADALAQFEKAVASTEKLPNNAAKAFEGDCVDGLAEVAGRRQEWKTAKLHLEQLLALAPEQAETHRRLGVAHFHLGDADAAFAALQRGAGLDPQHAAPELVLSELCQQAKRDEEAEAWMQRAVEAHPDNARVRTAESLWRLRQSDNEAALAAAEAAVKLAPSDREGRFARGLCLRHLRRFAEAGAAFQSLQQESPADLAALNQLALCLVEQEESATRRAGLQHAESLVRQAPQDRQAYATLGWAHYRNGNLHKARQSLETSISGGHGPAAAGYFLATVLRDLGETEAIPDLLAAASRAENPFMYRAETQDWLRRLSAPPPQ